VDFGSTPVRILLCQAPDQDANFLGDSRSATAPPGPPTPIEAETGTMPADDGVWVYNATTLVPLGRSSSDWQLSLIRFFTPASTLVAILAAVRDCLRTRAALQIFKKQ